MSSTETDSSVVSTTLVIEEKVDLWELFDPIDVLHKLPSSFKAEIESKKWLERKSALELLLQLLNDNLRLCPKAHYGEIVKSLCNVRIFIFWNKFYLKKFFFEFRFWTKTRT